MFRLLIPRDRAFLAVPSLTRGATVRRLHHLWWASRPMVTPLQSQARLEPGAINRCLTLMLEVRDLTKYYTSIPAVEGVSFAIRPREVLGYLGPNGSGKTTTVNMLIGLLEPTRGHIYFNGRDIRENIIEYK